MADRVPDSNRPDSNRIVITGVGLAAPNGNNLSEFRRALLEGQSGVVPYETRYMRDIVAGVCRCDVLRYQKKKDLRRGTRAGSLAIYCAHEAVQDARLPWETVEKARVGVFIGITEHGNVETENQYRTVPLPEAKVNVVWNRPLGWTLGIPTVPCTRLIPIRRRSSLPCGM